MPRRTPRNDDEEALGAAFAREFADTFAGREALTLAVSPFELLTLIGQLQLAARHPLNTGITANTAVALVTRWEREYFAGGALREVIRRGWHSLYDVEQAGTVIPMGPREE